MGSGGGVEDFDGVGSGGLAAGSPATDFLAASSLKRSSSASILEYFSGCGIL